MVEEKGDLELFTFDGEEGLEARLTVKFSRVRDATAAEKNRLHSDGIRGLGTLYPASKNEPHIVGIYIGL